MEKEKNIILVVIQNLKDNNWMIIEEKEKSIIVITEIIFQNLKENIDMIENGMEKDMIKTGILYMN